MFRREPGPACLRREPIMSGFPFRTTDRVFAPEHLPRVFDPFFTTKHKGRGLGLATAYSIVRKHDGLIEADSQAEAGATFHVYLPASAQTMSPERADANPPRTGQGRVLVMDDEPDILNFSHVALKKLGYQAELARDGTEAIRRYRDAREGRPAVFRGHHGPDDSGRHGRKGSHQTSARTRSAGPGYRLQRLLERSGHG